MKGHFCINLVTKNYHFCFTMHSARNIIRRPTRRLTSARAWNEEEQCLIFCIHLDTSFSGSQLGVLAPNNQQMLEKMNFSVRMNTNSSITWQFLLDSGMCIMDCIFSEIDAEWLNYCN
eukprot:m.225766 g.225766  ORF g.225766 m.225766 type:complete len:118 (+) comp40019_c0_seq3:6164-6517(+)